MRYNCARFFGERVVLSFWKVDNTCITYISFATLCCFCQLVGNYVIRLQITREILALERIPRAPLKMKLHLAVYLLFIIVFVSSGCNNCWERHLHCIRRVWRKIKNNISRCARASRVHLVSVLRGTLRNVFELGYLWLGSRWLLHFDEDWYRIMMRCMMSIWITLVKLYTVLWFWLLFIILLTGCDRIEKEDRRDTIARIAKISSSHGSGYRLCQIGWYGRR